MADAEKQPLLQDDTTTGYQGGQVDIVEGNLTVTNFSLLFFSLSVYYKQRKVTVCRIKMYASFLH